MNIAVFLPNWIGDVVMATPALRALRQHYPAARITGVLRPYVAGVLEGASWLDEQLTYNPHARRGAGDAAGAGTVTLARQLRQRTIDLAVLLPNSFRAALAAWLGRCRQRIGFARYARGPLLTSALQPQRDRRGRLVPCPVLDDYNRLAVAAGCPAPSLRLELFTTPADEARADETWRQARLDDAREVVCLNPGAAFGAAKHWPAESWAALARHFALRRGSGVLVLCGPSELEMARAIAARAAHPAVHALTPPLSLGLTKACIRRADLLVTTDSGPRHFGVAFDRPVLTLFGPTHIAWTETYHARSIHLQKPVPCGPCQLRVCPRDHACMRGLEVGSVYEAAARLLARFPAGAHTAAADPPARRAA